LQANTSATEKAVRHDQKRAVVMMALLVAASPRALVDELLACFTAEQDAHPAASYHPHPAMP